MKKKSTNTPVVKQDNIIPVDVREQYMQDMAVYSISVLYERFVPDIRDGLKPVQRRALYCMWHDVKAVSRATKRKSANTTGTTIAFYHPHGDAGVYGAMQTITNPWESKIPLINYVGNSGSIQGGPQAANRYTESYLSKFSMDAIFGDLEESMAAVDWDGTFDNHTEEPQYLPVKVPLLLVNGTFGIAIGERVEVPPHSLNDVIDATLKLLHDPNAEVVLIPDPCQQCEIVDTDWKAISNSGFGLYTQRGIIKIENNGNRPEIRVYSTPDMVTANKIFQDVDDMVKNNILPQGTTWDDETPKGGESINFVIHLKPGVDPEYVRQALYKHTALQDQKRVNMRVIVSNGQNVDIVRMSYKAYILEFLKMRRNVKFRLYNFRLQKAETRLHTIEAYISVLKSGDIENIIHVIRNQKPSEEAQLIEWLMKKLKVSDIQARYILRIQIQKLSAGNLKKFEEEQAALQSEVQKYFEVITNPHLIDNEIEKELLEIREKYGTPRKSIIISEAEASNIPQGTFKIALYESNSIRKIGLQDQAKAYRGDNPKCITVGDNDKDLILFDEMGKAFRLPIHKVSFSDKSSSGIDIRTILKNLTSNIISMMYLPIVEELSKKLSKYFLVVLTKQGLIKRIDLDDLLNVTPSGIIYSKLNPGDYVNDVLIVNHRSDLIVYTDSKALRISLESVPYLKRSTVGSPAIKSSEGIDGISVITADTKDVVVVTAKGRFNRISQGALPQSERNRSGTRVIRLTKGDVIKNIFTCSQNTVIRTWHQDNTFTDIPSDSIEMGSSISQGVQLTKVVIKAERISI